MINDIAKGIYDKLKANATLTTALGGVAGNGYKIYHIIARQNVTVPYITFGLLTDIPIGDFNDPTTIENTTWWFNVFSKTGSKNAGTIAGYVMAVLDNATLTVAGYNALECLREYIGSPIYNIETQIYQIPLRYRIWINKP